MCAFQYDINTLDMIFNVIFNTIEYIIILHIYDVLHVVHVSKTKGSFFVLSNTWQMLTLYTIIQSLIQRY